MSIHVTIRSHRLRLGMTEQQLADRVGVTRAAVQQWEREGGTAPRRSKQADVANVLGISLAELLGVADTAERNATGEGAMQADAGSVGDGLSVANTSPGQAQTLGQALGLVACALMLSDDLTRDQVRPLLARLVDEPGRAPEIVPRIDALLAAFAAQSPGTETHAFAGKPTSNESTPTT